MARASSPGGDVDRDRAAGADHERVVGLLCVVEQAPLARVGDRESVTRVLDMIEGAALAGDHEVGGERVGALAADIGVGGT